LTESFTLAVVGSPFGVNGFIKIKSLSGETGHLKSLKKITLRQNNKNSVYIIEESRQTEEKAVLLVKFAGIDSPETAKNLIGAEFIADRALAAPLGPAEYYIEDLKGLKVLENSEFRIPNSELSNARILGVVSDILEGGGGLLAEVRLPSGEHKLVPYRNEFFGDVNMNEGWIELLQPWILEE